MSTSDKIAALALIGSLGAASFSLLQWQVTHQQLILSMKPSIGFNEELDDIPIGTQVTNAGPGPAIIKGVTCFVDNRPVGDIEKAIEFAQLGDSDNVRWEEFEQDDTLAVGEKVWLLSYIKEPKSGKEQKG